MVKNQLLNLYKIPINFHQIQSIKVLQFLKKGVILYDTVLVLRALLCPAEVIVLERKRVSAVAMAAVLTLGSMGVYAAALDPNETVIMREGDASSLADESSCADSFLDGSSEDDSSSETDSSQTDDSSELDSKPDGPVINEEDFIVEELEDGTVKITGYSGGSDVIIPETLGGKVVTVIGSDAFSDRRLDTLVVPDSVTTIEDYAFWACGLKKITLGNGLTSIGEGAFMYMDDLEEIQFPDSLEIIGDWAFANCKTLNALNIPENCRSIGIGAFACCYKLNEVKIPKTVEEIGELAFGYFDRDDQNYCKLEGFSLKVYAGTAGKKYAEENELAYKLIADVKGTAAVNSQAPLNSDGIALTVVSDEFGGICEISVDGGKFCIECLSEGTYDFIFSAENCPDRTYRVEVGENTAELTAELCLYGDVNGDGKVSTADVGMANADVRNIKSLSDYSEKCADINGDGSISTADLGRINAHIRQTKALW